MTSFRFPPCFRPLVVFLLALAGLLSPVAAQTLTRGPYLQQETSTSVLIRWKTNTFTPSQVRYGTTAGTFTNTVTIASPIIEHQVRLTGLQPDTRYFYEIGTSRLVLGSGPTFSFYTAPTPATALPTRIWVLGDSGRAGADSFRVRDAYAAFTGAQYTDVWLMLGDNAYESGQDFEYQTAIFDQYATMLRQTALWPTLGNHDTAQSTNPPQTIPYFQSFSLPANAEAGGVASGTEKYYSFNSANIHFICLDSQTSSRAPASPMIAWLRRDLEAVSTEWIIAYWHHTPYSRGTHDSDTSIEEIEMRANVLPVLEAGGVDLVLAGHSHVYERSFLLNGHYGQSGTLAAAMKLNPGSGREDGSGAYHKPGGQSANQGAVYLTMGVSSSLGFWSDGSTATTNPNPHPAMFTSLLRLGSLVIDVSGTRMDVRFLSDGATVEDHFTILKDVPDSMPQVSITSPTEGSAIPGPSRVSVTASAQDADGTVQQVDFYAGARLIGSDREAPFEATWVNPRPGNYQITAVATDNLGKSVTSPPVHVRIKSWTRPPAPSGLVATPVSSSRIDLAWTDNSTNESHYGVFQWNGMGWTQVAFLPANTTTYSRVPLRKADHEYRFQVRAWNSLGYSPRSEVVRASTLP